MESILTTSQSLTLIVQPSLRMCAFKMDAEFQHCSPPALLSPRQTTSLSSQACSNSLLIMSLLPPHLLQSISTQQPEGSFTGGPLRMESETMSLLCSVPSDASYFSQDQSNNLPCLRGLMRPAPPTPLPGPPLLPFCSHTGLPAPPHTHLTLQGPL